MAGKCRPSLREKTLENVKHSDLSQTDKDCIAEVFKRYEEDHNEWIDVLERLPPENERVLVTLKDMGYNGVNHTIIDTDRRINGRWVRWSSYIAQWKPLPELPKGANNDR